jgi:uncharacterized protein with HEPN domain
MSIMQAGELTKTLSQEFRDSNPSIPWREIREMRNLYAHHYGELSATKIWDTAKEDIPMLLDFCNAEIERDTNRTQK